MICSLLLCFVVAMPLVAWIGVQPFGESLFGSSATMNAANATMYASVYMNVGQIVFFAIVAPIALLLLYCVFVGVMKWQNPIKEIQK